MRKNCSADDTHFHSLHHRMSITHEDCPDRLVQGMVTSLIKKKVVITKITPTVNDSITPIVMPTMPMMCMVIVHKQHVCVQVICALLVPWRRHWRSQRNPMYTRVERAKGNKPPNDILVQIITTAMKRTMKLLLPFSVNGWR